MGAVKEMLIKVSEKYADEHGIDPDLAMDLIMNNEAEELKSLSINQLAEYIYKEDDTIRMSRYAISAIRFSDRARVFLGKTPAGYFLWTKNPNYILHFDNTTAASKYWDMANEKVSPKLFEEVDPTTVFAGNIGFVPLTKLIVTATLKEDNDED